MTKMGRALLYKKPLADNGLRPDQNKWIAEISGDRPYSEVRRDCVDAMLDLLYSVRSITLRFGGGPFARAKLMASVPSLPERTERPEANTAEPDGRGRPQVYAVPLVKNGLRPDQWAVVRAISREQARNYTAFLRDCVDLVMALAKSDGEPVALKLAGLTFAEGYRLVGTAPKSDD